jgi:MtN3 and saliva related transmembrane protein
MLIKQIIDYLFGTGLFINASLFVPQIWSLIKSKDSNGTSLVTFSGFCALQMIAASYGYVNHVYIMAIGYSISFLLCSTISLLILYYRK